MKNKIHTGDFALLALVFAFAMKNFLLSMRKLILLTIISLIFASVGHAATYYVDGASIGGSCSDSNAGTLITAPWCTITKANTTLTAGDTVYIRAGTYSSYIAPSRSGTSSSRITYQNYASETVTISGTSYAVDLNGKSYITVQGINATGCNQNMFIRNSAHHNIIAYCNFTLGSLSQWNASVIWFSSQYNWIHHCTFSKQGQCTGGGDDEGDVLVIGHDDSNSLTDQSYYNVIENCTLYHGGHTVLGVFNGYNTVRNNYLHNEIWTNSKGNRCFHTDGANTTGGHCLFEGNRYGYSAQPCDQPSSASTKLTTQYNIFRHNEIYFSNSSGLDLAIYQRCDGSYNKIYNNTFFHSGYNIDPSKYHGVEDSAIFCETSSAHDNQIKNNLYYKNYYTCGGSPCSYQTFANNWDGDTQGDPKFVNASDTPPADKTDATLPNLDLQSSSPAIDKGGALTTVSSGCNTSSLTLADATYFQDGTWGPPGVLQADWVAVGTITNVAQISSISGNVVTFGSAISCTNGASVWLYKKSDGVQVLYGKAPDPGAYEFHQADAPSAPKNLRVIP